MAGVAIIASVAATVPAESFKPVRVGVEWCASTPATDANMHPSASDECPASIRAEDADYSNPAHAVAIVALLDEYASDPVGGGEPLTATVRERLIPALRESPAAFTVLAFAGDEPIGLLNGFETLSTFAALPVFNVHDVVVTTAWRRRGIARFLLESVEEKARRRGCCKLTLEVLEGNRAAQHLYRDMGFTAYSLRAEFGCAQFWQKTLD